MSKLDQNNTQDFEDPNPKFRLYKEAEDVPTYRGMNCYFETPFIATFNEECRFYYIILYNKKNRMYTVCMHDEEHFSAMNGGCIVENMPDAYQADEYPFDKKREVLDFLGAMGFNNETRDHAKKSLKKLKKILRKEKSDGK